MKHSLSLRFIYFMLAVIPIAMVTGCHKAEPYRIGVSQCSSDDWRSKMNEEILREAMLHDNVEVEIRSADDNSARQIADIEYFADNGFDIIIAAPNEAEALTPTIEKVYNSGIPVILFDREINGDSFTAFQGADNNEIGRLAAKMALKLGGDSCRIIEIRGLNGSSPEIGRHEGFATTAAELGLIVEGDGFGNWNEDRGAIVADSLLNLYPDATVVYAHNDRMAIAASEAAARLNRNMKIIGVDAAPAIGITAVNDSVIDATFLYPTSGGQLVKTALDILEGRPFERITILPSPSPVDHTNAELLLFQDNLLRDETAKIETLKGQLDLYWQQYSLQRALLYGAIIIIVLSVIVIFLLVRSFWTAKRHRLAIEQRNAELARQKDELSELYERLQEATSSKLNFFTNVSHDLRTPLTLIADPVSQLVKAENLTPGQHTLMQLADKNVKRLMRLVNQILDIRKFDNSHLKLKLASVDLAVAVREWAVSFTQLSVKRHVGFTTDIDPEGDYVTLVDIEKIERILFNLLSNAFKFTPENGRITVGLRRVDNHIVISVTDTGCGIPPTEIGNVFDRFFSGDHINPNGSGIGLALVKIFVEMHGGTIDVASTVGKGTTMTVKLPVR